MFDEKLNDFDVSKGSGVVDRFKTSLIAKMNTFTIDLDQKVKILALRSHRNSTATYSSGAERVQVLIKIEAFLNLNTPTL